MFTAAEQECISTIAAMGYPSLVSAILSVGNKKINNIVINGADPVTLIKRAVAENGDKPFWREMILRKGMKK